MSHRRRERSRSPRRRRSHHRRRSRSPRRGRSHYRRRSRSPRRERRKRSRSRSRTPPPRSRRRSRTPPPQYCPSPVTQEDLLKAKAAEDVRFWYLKRGVFRTARPDETETVVPLLQEFGIEAFHRYEDEPEEGEIRYDVAVAEALVELREERMRQRREETRLAKEAARLLAEEKERKLRAHPYYCYRCEGICGGLKQDSDILHAKCSGCNKRGCYQRMPLYGKGCYMACSCGGKLITGEKRK
jgi:hypothetical protein